MSEVKQVRQKASLAEQLDPYKYMGSDGIHPKILKMLADVITKTLVVTFELSWECEEIPADWKLENVVPIFQKGKKDDPRNYRRVSLSSVPGRVMEKIILGSIEKHLKYNTVTGHSQHNFMRGKSCLSNLISFLKRILLDKISTTQMDKHNTPEGAVVLFKGREALQRHFDKSEPWTICNHMKFNKGRCQILHLG
ncbi:rna-directed dna polymerase from mobile element jockey-like [Willisornis vidua]|uniref:Rna-directed dna polymerase from mobile element jockey-like n=1 Tax=Willisornis vidua TaxID=1566151 RepID=A0ABQ9DCZ5_9PASS|nr:rna-directed dna polymerase from mobile element jockey-like [Willisornis vidua]